jgi:hypothetical protein
MTAKESLRKINTMIGTIKRSKLQDQIHKCGLAIMEHAVTYGDHSAMTRLVEAIPSGIRKSDFNTWVLSFTPLNWDKEGSKYKKSRDKSRIWDVEGAKNNPFWEYTKDKDVITKPIDALKLLQSLIAKVEREQEEGGRGVENLEQFKAMIKNPGDSF